jgi:hypothetical protein
MRKLGLTAMLCLSICLMSGCSGNEKIPQQPAQSSEAVYHGEDVTPENLADQVTVESIVPYDGIFLEGDEKERVEDTYALKVTNVSEETILYATFNYRAGRKDLTFYLEMLPAGKSVIVAEQQKQNVKNEELKYVDGDIHYIQAGLENMESVKITPTKESTLKVKNKTSELLPVVWIFYRKAEADGTLLGGKCYDTGIVDLGARETYEAEAEFWMDDCEIVNVILLDSLDLLNTEEDPKMELEEEVTSNP